MVFLGLFLGLMSGVMAGGFSLPMKKTTRWSWEATWLVWSICALLIIPWGVAMLTVPDVFSIFGMASRADIIRVIAFGLCWGLGAVFFGQSIAMIGMSLAFALCIGLSTALGALIPMFKDTSIFGTLGGQLSATGVIVMVIGVAVCSLAGSKKDKQIKLNSADGDVSESGSGSHSSKAMLLGLTLAALGGIFSSLLNIAFSFSQGIKDAAIELGASKISAADPIWAITLFGGLITNVVYCSILLTRNRTWKDYAKANTTSHWFLATLMGAIWIFGVILYGRAAAMMGDLGNSAGWGIFMGMMVLVSSILGFITGEWRGVQGLPVRLMKMGIGTILFAIVLMGYATTKA